MYSPVCPHCGGELEPDKVVKTEHCMDDAVVTVKGYCYNCGKEYEWEDVFIYNSSRKIKEIKK